MIRARLALSRNPGFLIACLLLAWGALPCAAQTTPTIVLSASPNPAQYGVYTTLTATLSGSDGVPAGTIDFYYSTSTTACSADNNDIGTVNINLNGVATDTVQSYAPGTDSICGIYTPQSGSPYAGETAGPYQLTVDPEVLLNVTAPGEVESGTAVNFSFTLTIPTGGPTPNGTVTLYNPSNGAQLGQVTLNANGTIPPINGVTLTTGAWSAYYDGGTNYLGVNASGTVFQENGLTIANPDLILAGSAATTITLTGLNFAAATTAPGSTAYIASPSPAVGPTQLNTTYISPTQVQATIPATNLTTAGTLSVYVVTNGYQTNSVGVQVASPTADTITASANPTTFTYGTTASTVFGSTIAPGTGSTGGVPAGQISFSLAPQSGSSTTVGSAQLSQNTATTGSYIANTPAALDSGSSKMLTADFNNDGYFDVVSMPNPYAGASVASGPYLQVMLSTGANTFATEEEVFVGCNPVDFAVGDINNDGNPDIVVACEANENSATWPVAEYILGNGDGTFQAPVVIALSSTPNLITVPTQVALGDFSGDGFLDVALVDGAQFYVQVLFNDKATPFDGVYNPSTLDAITSNESPVVVAGSADFNQDGKSDLALVEYSNDSGTGAVLVLTSNGTGGFATTVQDFQAETSSQVNMTITDVNGDGYPDVAVADPGSPDSDDDGQILVFENAALGAGSNGTLNAGFSIPAASTGGVTGAPFPLLGKPASNAAVAPSWNLLYVSPNTQTGDLQITPLKRIAADNWQAGTVVAAGISPEYYTDTSLTYPSPIVAADVNGDGYLDATFFGIYGESATAIQSIEYSNGAATTLTNSPTFPTAGTYSLTATYPGNFLFAGGTGTDPTAITISPALPSGVLSGPSTAVYQSPVTLVATIVGVSGAAYPTGTVTFFDNGYPLQSPVPIYPGTGQATITTTSLMVGSNTITASYSGDVNYVALSTSNIGSLAITVSEISFSLGLSSSTTQTTSGTVVTFTATATGSSFPTLEPVTLSGLLGSPTAMLNTNGVATLGYGILTPGTYQVQAVYGGDSTFAPESSNTITLTVGDTPVSVSVQSSANPDTYPTPVSLTSTVSANGLGVPTGSVEVELGPSGSQTDLGSGNLVTVNGSSGLHAGTPFGASPFTEPAMVSGDFNGDGIPDLAWLQDTDGGVELEVALGNGDGTFGTPAVYSNVPAGSDALAAGVFNQSESKYSGVAVASSNGSVAVLLPAGNAAGDLTLSQTITGLGNLTGIASADFNKDGNPDLAVISNYNIYVFYGTASGTFPGQPSWTNGVDGSNYVGVAAIDLNGDGYADLAVTDSGNNLFWVYLYVPASGTFSEGDAYPAGASVGPIAAGDINGDGYPDLAVVSPTDSTVEILINNKSGGFPTGTAYAVPYAPDAVAMADFNRDGYADVAVATSEPSEIGLSATVLLGSASGAMTGEAILVGGYGTALATADFNGDGNPDLAFAYNGITPWLDSAAQYALTNVALPAGTDAITSTFTAAANTYWATGAQGDLSETVYQGIPTINWNTPAPITYGTALSSTQLDATSPVAGTFIYSPPAGSVLGAGTQTLIAYFTPTDSVDYQPTQAAVNLIVNQATTSVTWNNPAAITYGTALSATQLDATASVPGTFAYNPAAGTILTAGSHTLNVTFTPTDYTDYLPSNQSVTIVVNKATPTVTWQTPQPITYGTALSATQLDATATPAGGAFVYSPAAGAVLPVGNNTLSVTYTPVDTGDYTTGTASVTLVVLPSLTLTAINPSSGILGSAATTITLTGTSFSRYATVQLNGTTIASTYVSSTKMTAVLPASFLAQVGTGLVTVTIGQVTTPGLTFTVAAPEVQAQLSGPSSAPPGEQPTLTFVLSQGYPLPLQGTFSLGVQPPTTGGVVDPSVQFSTGGTTLDFTIPANSTTTPTVQLQTGTLAATITITLTLTADGQDVTPAGLAPVVIDVPATAPTISSVTLQRNGDTLSVTIEGFSSTREMDQANFDFTAADGSTISNPKITVDIGSPFTTWYNQNTSDQYGSAFTYVQNFDVSNNASTVAGVSVTLANSVGTSNSLSAH
jgi:Bacterial Ig-like domain (group 3)/FG-GAP-like repeat